MQVEIKYYQFTDPYTGVQSKDFGWVQNYLTRELKIKGDAVLKDSVVARTRAIAPRYIDVEEITKEQFDALDTKGESATVQLRREANITKVKSLVALAAVPEVQAEAKELAAKFAAAHSKK